MGRTETAAGRLGALRALHRELEACRRCPAMVGPVVHGDAVLSRILLVGQAPGPHEGAFGKPFAWTAGRTLFRWFESAGAREAEVRSRVYLAAVARCFPGKARSGGDRKPGPHEIARCREYLRAEVDLLEPKLVIPVGALAIERVLGRKAALAQVVGRLLEGELFGHRCEVLCLPHPSGASTWHKTQPGLGLLAEALRRLAEHPEWRRAFG
ncbi:MAG: uracil-DNA glycosylase [Myxococcales bacterium]